MQTLKVCGHRALREGVRYECDLRDNRVVIGGQGAANWDEGDLG